MHKYTEKRIIKIADYESRHIEYSIEGHNDSIIKQVSSMLNILETEIRSPSAVKPPKIIKKMPVKKSEEKDLKEEKNKMVSQNNMTANDMRKVINTAINDDKIKISDAREAFEGVAIDKIDPSNYSKILIKLGLKNT